MLRAAALTLLCATAAPARAEIVTLGYEVDAVTAAGLEAQMERRGPQGYWAYTTWWVEWTADCRVTWSAEIVLPRHIRPQALPADLRRRWDRMLENLRRHETEHAGFARQAAAAIGASGCRNGDDFLDRARAQDRQLDEETDHGRTTGVTLR
jgi:predicted secreted Zn-dependent protease